MGKVKDLTGQRFGKLIAIKIVGKSEDNRMLWLCKCDCGNEIIVKSATLLKGERITCGCSRTVIRDLIGKKFGKLTVIKRVENDKGRNAQWLCKCECGNETLVRTERLKSGNTKSCGCLRGNINSSGRGWRRTRLYKILMAMKARCYNKNHKSFKDYGGRGIKICDEWLNDYVSFFNWSIENGYNDTLTIDRINNDSNYEPENCRWVPMKVQNRNKSNCHFITYENETHCLTEWSEILGIPIHKITYRLKRGISISKKFNNALKR